MIQLDDSTTDKTIAIPLEMTSLSSPYLKLPTPETWDVISALQFSKFDDQLLVSSWDSKLLLYDVSSIRNEATSPNIIANFNTDSPVLSIAYGSNANSTFLGTLDGNIRRIDYENLKLFSANKPIYGNTGISSGIGNLKTIENKENLLVAASFKGEVQYIDTRIDKAIHTKSTKHKIFTMDTTSQLTCLGMSARTIEIYDHRNWDQPYQVRESGLKYQIKDLKAFPNGEGYALSSIDGRVSMEYFDTSPEFQSKKFAFKCHRFTDKQNQQDIVYPVNSLLFNKSYNTLFTAGSDGFVCLWNWEKRKRMKQYPKFTNPQAVVKLDINYNESLLAIATSEDSFKNQSDITNPINAKSSCLYIKPLGKAECSPKH